MEEVPKGNLKKLVENYQRVFLEVAEKAKAKGNQLKGHFEIFLNRNEVWVTSRKRKIEEWAQRIENEQQERINKSKTKRRSRSARKRSRARQLKSSRRDSWNTKGSSINTFRKSNYNHTEFNNAQVEPYGSEDNFANYKIIK